MTTNYRRNYGAMYLPRFDALLAGGLSDEAANKLISAEIAVGLHYGPNKNPALLAGRQPPPVAVAKPKAVAPVTPKAAAAPPPAPKPRTLDELQARVEELQQVAQVNALIAAHHRGELPVAAADPRSAELDRIFGTGPKTEPGVVMALGGAIQVFGAPVPVTPRKPQAAPAVTPQRVAAAVPPPSPGVPSEFTARLDAAFGDGKPADGVRIVGSIQQFGVKL